MIWIHVSCQLEFIEIDYEMIRVLNDEDTNKSKANSITHQSW